MEFFRGRVVGCSVLVIRILTSLKLSLEAGEVFRGVINATTETIPRCSKKREINSRSKRLTQVFVHLSSVPVKQIENLWSSPSVLLA